MELIGKVLGNRYEIIEEIGIGGMATVYKAKCKLLNRFVAVKVLKKEFATDQAFVKRFRAEAQSAASLTHPNIVSIYDVGEEDGCINYIVMELLEGKTLKDYIETNGKMDSLAALKYASQIASALEAAHKSKIIHRDIKPQNIVFSSNDKIVKVTDFGIAKMTTGNTITGSATTMGSVHYFSPEHAKGNYIDEKSDIYSLGVVMYEMATGILPFNADTPVSVALKQIQEVPRQPKEIDENVSEDLNRIIMKSMEKSTANRYQTATEMLDDIFAGISNPGRLFKSEVKLVAGGTQVIPIIGLKDDTPSLKNIDDNHITDDQENKQNIESFREKLKEKNREKDSETKLSIDAEKIIKQKKQRGLKNKRNLVIFLIIMVLLLTTFTTLIVKLVQHFNAVTAANTQIKIVPDIVGLEYEKTSAKYFDLGLKINVNKYEYSSEIEDGYIISQIEKPGENVIGNQINVVVSKGEQKVKMIDVVGKDYTVAKYELDSLGIVAEFKFAIDDKIKQNIIIEQDVSTDTEIAVGAKVNIRVSKGNGKEVIIIPNLIGKTEKTARLGLDKLNISVVYSEDKTKADGIVIAQSLKENQEVEEGTALKITINRIEKTKEVTIDLASLIKDPEKTSAAVKVTAKVEGVTNTVYNQNKEAPFNIFNVEINGFTTAIVYTYVDSVLVDEKTITF